MSTHGGSSFPEREVRVLGAGDNGRRGTDQLNSTTGSLRPTASEASSGRCRRRFRVRGSSPRPSITSTDRAPAHPGACDGAVGPPAGLPVITPATTGADRAAAGGATGRRAHRRPDRSHRYLFGQPRTPGWYFNCEPTSGRGRLPRPDRARRRPRSRRRRARGSVGAGLPALRRLPGVRPPDRSPPDPRRVLEPPPGDRRPSACLDAVFRYGRAAGVDSRRSSMYRDLEGRG